MATSYAVTQSPHPDFPDLTAYALTSPTGISVTFVPQAGMVGSSLTDNGVDLLGMRTGLRAYRESGKALGSPLPAPRADRLEHKQFGDVTLVTDGTPGVHPDANGLPIHGLLAGCPDWKVTRCEAVGYDAGVANDQVGAWLVAELEFDNSRPEFPAFPFAHVLTVSVQLLDSTVRISTSVRPTSDAEVPIAFGWHPYFAPPGGDRQDWTVCKPFTHHLVLDDRCVPTGEVDRVPVEVDVLGNPDDGGLTFDDLFDEVPVGTKAWIEGGKHRITLSYDEGYSYAVLFAPPDQPLVAIEPMTAPTDPLAGHFPIKTAKPGESYTATYGIHVTESGVSA